MKLGVFTVLYQDLPFEQMLDKVAEMGLETIELGTGMYPGDKHCNTSELLEDKQRLRDFKRAIEDRNLSISALSFHGNPLHPQEATAKDSHDRWRRTVELAEQLEVPIVTGFSGCPGDSKDAKYPNWVTCSWPSEYSELLEWQWNEVVTPYWQTEAAFAKSHGVERIAFEMHPGFVVYNPETLLKLRERVGKIIGANIDPSHLFWQGIDPVEAIRELGKEDAVYYMHAKDTYLDKHNINVNGVLDTKHYGEVANRSWTFRTVGYGQDEKVWRDIISMLRTVGYDYVLSIEHEDMLASTDEGLKKAITFLKQKIFREEKTNMWWA